ncbi:hypothetical protein Peur_010611 [Populus x canadensis]|uniref:uncharacterized protein LOC133690954 isoform X1 n=1 Tax=Populus nigra TaxID=3691 RepID=UPI002B26B1FA|nr:uncharacterized protein LOC133690954 isoform X1 [Populus nigra]
MELEVSSPISSSAVDLEERNKQTDKDQVRVRRKTLVVVLQQCQRALELLNNTDSVEDDDEGDTSGAESREVKSSPSRDCSSTSFGDREADELCDLLKSRVECPEFLEKLELECAQLPGSQYITEDGSSWDMVSGDDLWEGENDGSDQEDYVLVQQEDIVEGIACFMAAYLLSLKQTKDLAPAQLQEALSKTFSVKKKTGKLRKAWDGSKVIYNAASWGATAIGLYQNPVLFRAASKAFWTSCHVMSKLL